MIRLDGMDSGGLSRPARRDAITRIYTIIASAPPPTGLRWRSCKRRSSSFLSRHSERRLASGGSVSTAHVTTTNVSNRFGSHQALDDVFLEIATGEAIVILGPSGCGKTTRLRLIAGLDAPDSGGIWLSHAATWAASQSQRSDRGRGVQEYRYPPCALSRPPKPRQH